MAIVRHDQALRRFRTHLASVEGHAETTVANYTSSARHFFLWAARRKKNWTSIGIDEASQYWVMLQRRYAPTTANLHLKALKSLYRWGQSQRLVEGNPWDLMRRAQGEPEKRYVLSLDELERIKVYNPDDWFGRRDRAIVLFLLSTGMRITACVRLDLSDVDLADGLVRCRDKGNRTHWKAIVGPAAEALAEWIEDLRPLRIRPNETALWIGRFGRRIDHHTIRAGLARVRQACDIDTPVTPHDLRRTPGRLMRRAGVPKEDIQKFYNHKRLSTTEIYTDEDDERGIEVARRFHPLLGDTRRNRKPKRAFGG